MAQIIVTPQTLKQKATELRNQNKKLLQQIQTLEQTGNTLKGQWEGDAKDKFYAEFNRDKVQMKNFYNAIEDYCRKLDEIAAKYAQTEAKNASLIKHH